MNRIPVKQMSRTLHIRILRHNPHDPDSVPRLQSFELEEADTMTLFIALNEIRQTQDPSLQFDFVCRAGICGSCGMIVNGRPALACRTLTRDLPVNITLAPGSGCVACPNGWRPGSTRKTWSGAILTAWRRPWSQNWRRKYMNWSAV